MMRLGLLVGVLVLAVDQAVKAAFLYGAGFAACAPCRIAEVICRPCPPVEVLPFINFVMVWNPGISFGLFPAESLAERLLLIAFAAGVTVVLVFWLRRVTDWLLAVAIGLIIGGALGNLIDRMVYGAVADFIDFHLFGYHWYTFNVADAAIVVGVGALLLDALVLRREAAAPGGNSSET